MDQIATFHTHLGAMSFQRRLKAAGGAPAMMPVPRALSASCGTCVKFTLDFDPQTMADEDLDAVYAAGGGGTYRLIFQNDEE